MSGAKGVFGFTPEERGAALVEFAILAPLLILLLFGIVEFGYKFGQFNDVRHATREAARYAAVDAGNNAAIEGVVCTALEGFGADISNLVVRLDQGGGSKGQPAWVSVIVDVDSLTNLPLISSFLPDQLSSTVTFRLEQNAATWGSQNLGAPPWTPATCL